MRSRFVVTLPLAVAALGLSCEKHTVSEDSLPTVRSIVGGNVATTCQWPSTITVLPTGCSGVLVHTRAIITAKHCLEDLYGKPPTTISFGELESNPATTVPIAKCYAHPSNDFGICTLAQDVLDVPIVPVMAPCEVTELKQGAPIVEAGFGATTGGLNATFGTKAWISGTLSDSANDGVDIMVTSGSQDGEYFGDSGGPLFFRMPDTTWRVIGVDCCSPNIIAGSKDPRISTYKYVPYHVTWAEQQTGLDLTPCHDAKGWTGGSECNGFPTNPARSGGTWSNMCQGQNLLLAATCGGTLPDGGAASHGGATGDASAEARGSTSDARFPDAGLDSLSAAETSALDLVVDHDGPADRDGDSDVDSAHDGSDGTRDVASSGEGDAAAGSDGAETSSPDGDSSPTGGKTTQVDATGSGESKEPAATKSSSGCSCRLQGASQAGTKQGAFLVAGLLSWISLRRRRS